MPHPEQCQEYLLALSGFGAFGRWLFRLQRCQGRGWRRYSGYVYRPRISLQSIRGGGGVRNRAFVPRPGSRAGGSCHGYSSCEYCECVWIFGYFVIFVTSFFCGGGGGGRTGNLA